METVKELLESICIKKGYEPNKCEMVELLDEANVVYTGGEDEHRWYIYRNVVVELEGYYIAWYKYIITGDGCMSDMDLEYDLDEAYFVERKERNIVEVYYE